MSTIEIRGSDYSSVRIEPELSSEERDLYFTKSAGFPRKPSIINLGIYYDIARNEARSERFVGIMPLSKWINSEDEGGWEKPSDSNVNIIISSRFGDPMKMLQTVLESRERYDKNIADMLLPNIDTWENWSKKDVCAKDSNVLYGIIKDVPEISLPKEADNQENNIAKLMSDINSIFEVSNFLDKLKKVCRTVIKKSSIRHEENLVGKVKGRINIQKQIKHNLSHGRLDRNYCVYNKMDIDNLENRILKYALYLCKKWSIQSGDIFSEEIAFCENQLRDVKLVKCCKKDAIGIKNNGAYKQYKEAIEAAVDIFERMSISFNDEKGVSELKIKQKVAPFFIRMDLLFELYCRAIVEKALDKINEKNYQLVPYSENELYVFGKNKKVIGFQNKNIPDILIKNDNKVEIVMDVKYIPLDEKEDYMVREITHQVLAYMLITDAKYGGFIYPSMEIINDENPVQMTNKSKYGYSIGLPMNCNDYEQVVNMLSKFE
jgi:hypothetical protein